MEDSVGSRKSVDVKGPTVLVIGPKSSTSFSFSEIQNVWGVRLGMITYDENFLIIELMNGVTIDVGELDDGFSVLLEGICENLPDFAPERVAELDGSDGRNVLIWASTV
jgi:hypothetical protein